MKFTPLEEIDCILNRLVKFANTNEYDFTLFDKYAEEHAKVFNMYFSKIENEDDKQKILSQLDENFHFLIDDVVTDMLASGYDNGSIIESNIEVAIAPNDTIPDYRVSGFKGNYRELILLFKSKIKTSEPQQPETNKTDEVTKELHNHIFKGNAFEVWQSMFDSFQITESSRTDVKFMFEEMKKDGLIHNTVNQKTFLDWLSEPPYQITVQKTSNYSKTKERISIYSNAKQLYKS